MDGKKCARETQPAQAIATSRESRNNAARPPPLLSMRDDAKHGEREYFRKARLLLKLNWLTSEKDNDT